MNTCLGIVLLLLGQVSVVHGFIAVDLCVGRCGAPLDTSKSCQCNNACRRYHDCCLDYHQICDLNVVTSSPHTSNPGHIPNANSLTMSTVADALWNADQDRFRSGEITLNYGSKTSSGNRNDVSSQHLFARVNQNRLQRPVYRAFIALLDNYNPNRGHADPISQNEQTEIDHFLDVIMATDVMKITYAFLNHNGFFTGDEAAFRHRIETLWFRPYGRSSHGPADSSAFEHIFVGEYKGSSVEGFHNWIRFYLEEKNGLINYLGYMKQHGPNLLEFTFNWRNHYKKIDSFFVGSSPEFEMALDTICILSHPNSRCHFKLNNVDFSIQTWDVTHISGIQIASAYTVF